MKKIFFIGLLLSLLFPIDSLAQQEHLKFMGIPIDGHVNDFRKKLKEKGFTYDQKIENSYSYDVFFAGDKSSLFVIFNDETKIVNAVSVNIECYSEESVKEKYRQYVRDLTDKYHAKEVSEILDSYKDTPEKFYPDVENGKFKEFNILITDSAMNVNNETDIMISRAVLNHESVIITSPLEMCMWSLCKNFLGNVGRIKVYYEYDDEDDVYDLNIIYFDTLNNTE